LRVLLRYSIALGLTSYAIAKILPLQFPPLNAFSLEQRLGQLPPMALLWSFMEYSRPYNFFGGAIELAPARLPNWARWTGKTALVGSVLVSSLAATIPAVRAQPAASSSLDGAWVVTEFSAAGRAVGANHGTPPWRRLIVAQGVVAIELASDSVMFCRRSTPERVDRLAFACRNNRKGEMQLTRSGSLLQLDGEFDGSTVKLTARHLDRSDYPLLSRGFRWIDDR
jgi:hypothetical protein